MVVFAADDVFVYMQRMYNIRCRTHSRQFTPVHKWRRCENVGSADPVHGQAPGYLREELYTHGPFPNTHEPFSFSRIHTSG